MYVSYKLVREIAENEWLTPLGVTVIYNKVFLGKGCAKN